MNKFTKEFMEDQLKKWHNCSNDEWLLDCWNNYGLALEYMKIILDDLHLHEAWHRAYKGELEQERRWFSVRERIPENGIPVLVYNGKIFTAFFDYNENWVWYPARRAFSYVPGVTHWKPLPQPPSEEE